MKIGLTKERKVKGTYACSPFQTCPNRIQDEFLLASFCNTELWALVKVTPDISRPVSYYIATPAKKEVLFPIIPLHISLI